MLRVNAIDKYGIPRVWGEGRTPSLAETNCRWELQEYLLRRKEMRLEDFSFQKVK